MFINNAPLTCIFCTVHFTDDQSCMLLRSYDPFFVNVGYIPSYPQPFAVVFEGWYPSLHFHVPFHLIMGVIGGPLFLFLFIFNFYLFIAWVFLIYASIFMVFILVYFLASPRNVAIFYVQSLLQVLSFFCLYSENLTAFNCFCLSMDQKNG